MEYRRFGETIVARLDRGEEIHEQLRALCEAERVHLASVQGIGAVGEFTVGVFLPAEKRYEANTFTGCFEIVSLSGTVTTMDGKYYAHLHMSAGDEHGAVFGGHLNRANVSATCELVIRVLDGTVERRADPDVGLNLFEFL